MIEINKIYNEDCMNTLDRMSDDFLDLTVTSPPYNVDLGNNKYNKSTYDIYKDDQEYPDYLKWLELIFSKVYQKTKHGGRCCINIGDGKNGKIPTHCDISNFMVKLKWLPMTTIIWRKNQIGNRTSWGSFLSPSSPSFPSPFEYILIYAKGDRKLQWKGNTDLTKEEFISFSLAEWSFAPETKMKKMGHPAMFPVELPRRCIKMLSWKDSIVYDPFMGSGTTAVACRVNGRNFIGSEISEKYCKKAEDRIKNIFSQQSLF